MTVRAFMRFSFSRKDKPKEIDFPVSVIVVGRNEAENFKKHLPLLCQQDYPNFEVVAVNDQRIDLDQAQVLVAKQAVQSAHDLAQLPYLRQREIHAEAHLSALKGLQAGGIVYLDGDQYKKAITAINKGLSRGGVKRPDNARLVLGMAYFNDKQYGKARDAFKAAARDKRSEKYAAQWMQYMDSELERQRKLQEEG